MSQILKLNAILSSAQAVWTKLSGWTKLDVRLMIFLIIPLSALAYQFAGTVGFTAAALLLPASFLVFRGDDAERIIAANGDGVTGLPTPSQLDAMIRDWPQHLQGAHKKTACFLVRVDRYSDFLEHYGDTAGFQLQRGLAERLQRVLRQDDLVARIADGTFKCMLLPVRHLDLEICIHMANRVKSALESPLMIDGNSTRVTVSIGFCISGQMKSSALSALDEGASIALSAAQKANHSSIRAFSPTLLKKHQNRKKFCEEARDALFNKEVKAWFQPQISTETGEISGFEALARWHHPQHGVMPPGEFLDTLAESGQLEKL